MPSALTLAQTNHMLRQVAHDLIQSQDALTQADRAIGDGDHGVGMARGCEAMLGSLETGAYTDLKGLFSAAGLALLTSIGGASGIIFGSWFSAGGKNLAGLTTFDAAAFIAFLHDGLAAVQARGKAKPGDKTMVDALFPAFQAAQACERLELLAVIDASGHCRRPGRREHEEHAGLDWTRQNPGPSRPGLHRPRRAVYQPHPELNGPIRPNSSELVI